MTNNTPPEPPKPPKPSVVVSSSKAERIFLIISCICIIGGAVLFIYGEQAVGIGQEGVVNKFLGSLGMAVASIGMFIVGCFFVKRIVLGLKSMSASERSKTRKAFARQLSIAALNVLVYGALFILLLGSLTALDGASVGTYFVVFAVWAACIASFVLYRRHRKKHKVSYELLKQPAITAFLFLFAVVILVVFIRSDVPDPFQDLIEGPETAEVLLVEADIDHPSARYSAIMQDQHVLTFCTADEERIVLVVPEKDIAAAKVINDYGNFVHLTYYPRTQVFCEATPWETGVQDMDPNLLEKLVEEYDFDL